MPFQRLIFSGSERNSQTVSGLASITTSRVTESRSVVLSMLPSLLSFCFAFEGLEALVPELVEERLHVGKALRARPVEAPGAVPSLVHEPRLLQDGQVLRDRGSGHVEVRGDLARRQLTVAHEPQDGPPPGLGDRLQRSFHGVYVSSCLR